MRVIFCFLLITAACTAAPILGFLGFKKIIYPGGGCHNCGYGSLGGGYNNGAGQNTQTVHINNNNQQHSHNNNGDDYGNGYESSPFQYQYGQVSNIGASNFDNGPRPYNYVGSSSGAAASSHATSDNRQRPYNYVGSSSGAAAKSHATSSSSSWNSGGYGGNTAAAQASASSWGVAGYA